jgi:hypothetical protein
MDILGCKEFCKREWALRGNFVVVESKKDMRKRTGESPDCADADVVCLATVLENEPGFMGASLTTALSGDTDGWKKLLEKYNVDEALVLDMSV